MKSLCKLVYIKQEIIDGTPQDIETIIDNVKCNEQDVFASRFYNIQKNGINLTKVLHIRIFHTKDINGSKLSYAIVDNVKYKIEKISKINGKNAMLDLSEVL